GTSPQPGSRQPITQMLASQTAGRGYLRSHNVVTLARGEGLENGTNRRVRNARRFPSERGGGTIKAILWSALLVYGAFVAYKIIPAYVAEYQLADKMAEQARFAVVNHYPEEQIRDIVFKTVQELEIPARREDIKIV